MKKIILALLAFVLVETSVTAQDIRIGVYAGFGLTGEKSDYLSISTLPVSKGGINLHYGIHANIPIIDKLELETGLQKVTKGYTYTANNVSAIAEYTKILCASVPVMAMYHLVDYPEEMAVRLSFGLGLYGSYAISGKITDENGTTKKAKFSNAKRMEVGPRWMAKCEFLHKFEAYIANDIRATNVIKSGNGYLKQGSFQVGLGYVF